MSATVEGFACNAEVHSANRCLSSFTLLLCSVVTGPYTEYKVQVAAFSQGGRGKFSEKYPALTDILGNCVFRLFCWLFVKVCRMD